MPVYRWDVMAADDFRWLRDRARRSADLYDGYRVDHLVGFYRTYGRPRDGGEPFFTPADGSRQIALGERSSRSSASRRGDHRRGSRHGARLRARVARAPRHAGLSRASDGSGTGTRRPAVPRSRRVPGGVGRRHRHARHRTDGDLVGARRRGRAAEGRRHPVGAASRRRPWQTGGSTRPCATRCSRRCSPRDPTCCIAPIQDVFGWRDRINEPATLTTKTGPSDFRGRPTV